MILHIPGVLSKDQAADMRTRLEAADWVDGRVSVGEQGAKVKQNRQLPEQSPLALELGGMIQAAEAFGHTRRQAIRYANADAPVPKLVAAAMRLVLAGRIALDDLMPPPKATS